MLVLWSLQSVLSLFSNMSFSRCFQENISRFPSALFAPESKCLTSRARESVSMKHGKATRQTSF